MTVLSNLKVFSGVMNDVLNTYYSDREYHASLGAAESFFLEVKSSNVLGATPKIDVKLETSDDGMSWSNPPVTIYNGATLASNAFLPAATVQGVVGGRFSRLTFKLNSGTTTAYVECWVTSRDAT